MSSKVTRTWNLEFPDKRIYGQLVELVIEQGVRKATKYLSEKMTVKATSRGKRRHDDRAVEVLVTVGRPNYEERDFIKKCKAAGEPFPVKKVQLKLPKGKK